MPTWAQSSNQSKKAACDAIAGSSSSITSSQQRDRYSPALRNDRARCENLAERHVACSGMNYCKQRVSIFTLMQANHRRGTGQGGLTSK